MLYGALHVMFSCNCLDVLNKKMVNDVALF